MENETNILKLVAELKDKATKYENQAERGEDYAKRLKEAVDLINGVIKDLTPYAQTSEKTRAYTNYKPILKEVWDKMQHGFNLSTAFLKQAYGLNASSCHYILTEIRGYKGVAERREGRNVFLYVVKEV